MKRRDSGFRTREFRDPTGRTAAYALSVPLGLWKQFRKRCREFKHPDGTTGISVRARILTLITRDVEEARPHDEDSARALEGRL